MSRRKENNSKEKIKIKKYIIMFIMILVIVATFILIKINKKDEVQGTWTTDDVTIYEFNGRGKGKMIVPMSEYPFSYIIHNNEIYIDFQNEEARDSDYEYKIENEQLILTGIKSTSGTYIFNRK